MTGVPGMALAFLILALGGVSAWDRALLCGSRSARAIEIRASGAAVVAVVVLASGETIAVRAVRGIGVTRHWVALGPLSLAGRGVLVTAGMLGPAAFRILRLWALWGRIPGVASGQLPA
ncbi:MAG: hypothetical protein AABM33_14365 [Pseudomonadota bacterium]